MRMVGTVVRGVRAPIIKAGDDLAQIVVDSILEAQKEEGFKFRDKDIIAVTEAVVGKAEGNFVTVDDIANDIKSKYPSGEVGLVFPILSRNRFSICLKGIARGAKKIYIQLSFPSDEVGNGILDEDVFENSKYNLSSVISEKEYDKVFGTYLHPFTGINMVDFYRELVKSEECEVEFVFSNDPKTILDYTNNVLACDIHTRAKTKKLLSKKGVTVYDLTDIVTEPGELGGCNPEYGLLGSNKSTEEKLKLFPKTGQNLVEKIQKMLK